MDATEQTPATPEAQRDVRGTAGVTRPRRRRRPGQVRRTAGDVRTVWYLLLATPLIVLSSLIDGLRDLQARFKHAEEVAGERAPFHRPTAMPIAREARSVADVSLHLRELPWSPTPLPARTAFYRTMGADAFGVLVADKPSISSLPHIYPRAFKPRLFTGFGGEQIAGLQAMHDTAGPALIIAPGLLTTKNFDYVRRVARRAFSEWGFHVVCIDLRQHGQTAWTSQAPSSAGYAEGGDVHEIAKALRNDPRVTSVGAMGFSLGGCTVLNAAAHASRAGDGSLDGGVLSLSGPTELERATEYISTKPPVRDPFYGMWSSFQVGLRQAERRYEVKLEPRTFSEMTRRLSLPWYGVDQAEFRRRGSAVEFAGEISVPTLAVHAEDDYIVPVEHALLLEDATRDNPNVDVWVVDRGSHCSFDAVDARWYYSVVRRWFEYWADEAD